MELGQNLGQSVGEIAPILRQAREAAGLTRPELARRAGLSLSTLKNAEAGRRLSRATLRTLLRLPELGIPARDLGALVAGVPARDLGALLGEGSGPPPLNAWIAPGYDPIERYRQMVSVLSGAGGHVEQSFMYLDPGSAADWIAIASHAEYTRAHHAMPLDRAAQALARRIGALPVDLVALGPGDGALEVRLGALLAAALPRAAGRFYLLDISQPLLSTAYRRAADTLASHGGLSPIAVQGDFHRLPQYGQLLYVPAGSPRLQVVAMLGGTFASLDNEVHFVRDSLCGFGPGSLLLLDYPCCFAPASDPDEVRRRDPWLSEDPLPWRAGVGRFLQGPIRRYAPCAEEIELQPVLSTQGVLPGSYMIEILARVRAVRRPERRFSVFRLKRHVPASVIAALGDLGWAHVDGWGYGEEVGYRRTLSLFQRA